MSHSAPQPVSIFDSPEFGAQERAAYRWRTEEARSPLNPTGMFTQVELITPERAALLLASNKNPRGVIQKRLEAYIESRKARDWPLHHQGIAIDSQGFLRDAQHRLRTVVETQLPTRFCVAYNVPEDGVMHIDEQCPRSIAVALRAAGRGDFSDKVTATARVLLAFPEQPSALRQTPEQLLEVLTDHANALDFSERRPQVKGIDRASVRALLARAYYHVSEEVLLDFIQVLRTGVPVSEYALADAAALRYRVWLMEKKGSGVKEEQDRYCVGQRALAAFIEDEPLTKLYGTPRDLFPLPGKP